MQLNVLSLSMVVNVQKNAQFNVACVARWALGFRAFYSLVWRIYEILLRPLFLELSGFCWFVGIGASLPLPSA